MCMACSKPDNRGMSIRVFRADGDQRPPPRKGQTAPWGREPGADGGFASRPPRPQRDGQGPRPERTERRNADDRPAFSPRGDRPAPRRDDGFAPRRDAGFSPRRDAEFAPRRPSVVPPPATPESMQALAALQATLSRQNAQGRTGVAPGSLKCAACQSGAIGVPYAHEHRRQIRRHKERRHGAARRASRCCAAGEFAAAQGGGQTRRV